MKTILRRAGILVLAWASTVLLLTAAGYLVATHSVFLRFLMENSARNGTMTAAEISSKYGNIWTQMDRELAIGQWILFPLMFALIGALVGLLEKSRPVLLTIASALPLTLAMVTAISFQCTECNPHPLRLAAKEIFINLAYMAVAIAVALLVFKRREKGRRLVSSAS
jgi:hypothetical protein